MSKRRAATAPAKTKNSPPLVPAGLRKLLRFLWGPGRTFTLLLLLTALFFVGWLRVWTHVRRQVLASSDYLLRQENVIVVPANAALRQEKPSPWIHSDVRAEALRDASLDDGTVSIMDDSLAARIYNAFSLHPWVAKVNSVKMRSPAQVVVDLVYRQPVCMVETAGGSQPVDAAGVWLPAGDFSPVEQSNYLRLCGVETKPLGPVGQCWGDPRVIGGAAIAAAMGDDWKSLHVDRIVALPKSPTAPLNSEPLYALCTRGGTQVYWGLAPDAPQGDELSTPEKIGRLKQYLRDHGTLDGRDGPQMLDVRQLPPPAK